MSSGTSWENSPLEAMMEPLAMEVFFYTLSKVPFETRCEAVYNVLDINITDLNRFSLIGQYLDLFIGSPDSDYWDDELYLASQRHIIHSAVPDEYKVTPKWRIELFSKTTIGNEAPNIPLKDYNGNITDLYSQHMPCLLIFANSDCEACQRELTRYNEELQALCKTEWNTVTVYLDGTIPSYANSASFADIDNNIIDNDIYVAGRLPSVYILDRRKKIVARDISLQDALDKITTIDNASLKSYDGQKTKAIRR